MVLRHDRSKKVFSHTPTHTTRHGFRHGLMEGGARHGTCGLEAWIPIWFKYSIFCACRDPCFLVFGGRAGSLMRGGIAGNARSLRPQQLRLRRRNDIIMAPLRNVTVTRNDIIMAPLRNVTVTAVASLRNITLTTVAPLRNIAVTVTTVASLRKIILQLQAVTASASVPFHRNHRHHHVCCEVGLTLSLRSAATARRASLRKIILHEVGHTLSLRSAATARRATATTAAPNHDLSESQCGPWTG